MTFADLAAACVQNATGRNYDSFIVTEFVTPSVLDLSSSSSVSFDRDSLMLPVELTCHSFTPPTMLFYLRFAALIICDFELFLECTSGCTMSSDSCTSFLRF